MEPNIVGIRVGRGCYIQKQSHLLCLYVYVYSGECIYGERTHHVHVYRVCVHVYANIYSEHMLSLTCIRIYVKFNIVYMYIIYSRLTAICLYIFDRIRVDVELVNTNSAIYR